VRVAVVGAGIAGLQAARRLDEADCEVRLFDKSRGAGGRLSTRRTDHGPFDHGAQYLTARDPRFRRCVEAWLEAGVVARWDPRCVRFSERGMQREQPEAREQPRYVGLPGMSGIARALRGELPGELATRIERVERRAGRWSLHAESGACFDGFDALVVAVPAPQAVPLLGASPELEAIARGADMLPCHAVLASFVEPVAVDFDAASFDRGPLAWAARNAAKPGREGGECWVLHSSADWSRVHVEADAEEVQRTLLGTFRAALGADLPAAGLVASHRWLYARPAAPRVQRQWDPAQALGICGDWLAGARVEDAFLSGERLADAMLGTGGERAADAMLGTGRGR
jgi:predicted NAD/FAD-dependent oxidoreductase